VKNIRIGKQFLALRWPNEVHHLYYHDKYYIEKEKIVNIQISDGRRQ